MRSAWLVSLLMIAGCGRQQPEKGVDTTLPSEPAKISGSLSGPDEYMPSDIQVCVETPAGQTISCKAKIDSSIYSGGYEIEVPAGTYRVYAMTKEVPNYKAYYTGCSSDPSCSHKPVVVKVDEGESRTGVDPNDWANRPTPPSPVATDEYTEPMNSTDMNMYSTSDDETSSNEPIDDE